jgi:NAD(P)-dependent dehydrogenase (short-subunit alcohol dehydrogenase family)
MQQSKRWFARQAFVAKAPARESVTDMDLGLRGRSALITGGSKGIGQAVAMRLAAEGSDLHLAARTRADLERTRDEIRAIANVRIDIHPVDLRVSGAAAALAAVCADVDILINNAGATPTGPIEEATEDKWREGLDLKVIATVMLAREIYLRMCARRSGVIVNVIGNCGERPDPEIIVATVTNTGLMGFTRALGSISPRSGVRVLGVNPGPTLTERLEMLMRKKARDRTGDEGNWNDLAAPLPMGRAATPEEVADIIVFAASERASYVSGTILTVDGGVSAVGRLF